MERVIILGCGGAGKSTLARAMGEKTGIPVVHLDRIWWRENWEHISREEFDAQLLAEIEKPRWIIDGNYNRTIPQRLEHCDTVVYLDFPPVAVPDWDLEAFFDQLRQNQAGYDPGCPEQLDWEFFLWVWNFNKNNRVQLYEMLNGAEHVRVHILKNRREAAKYLSTLSS